MHKLLGSWWRRPALYCGSVALSIVLPVMAEAAEPELLAPPKEPAGEVKELPRKPLTLTEAVQLGLERQPAIAAARASLAAAQAGQVALENLHAIPLLPGSHELCVRRKQAQVGVLAADAYLKQVEQETIYAVTRTYLTAVYAEMQLRVATNAVKSLEGKRKRVQAVLGGEKKDERARAYDLDRIDVHNAMALTRQEEAAQGRLRALAALREAIGLGLDCCPQVVDMDLPPVRDIPCCGELVAMALDHRSDLRRAGLFAELTELEIDAQGKACGPKVNTFAAGGDIHAKPVPQGVANGEYRPGAVGPEMPVLFAGKKCDRVRRAQQFADEAAAIVDKTRALVVLEVEDAYFRWVEAAKDVQHLQGQAAKADKVADEVENAVGGVDEDLRMRILARQVEARYNEALYHHALLLVTLERATGGGFCAGFGYTASTPPAQDKPEPRLPPPAPAR